MNMSTAAPGNQYLEASVLSASPARLRLMLLERAVETAAKLSASWRDKETEGSTEHSVQLLDLITELLAGIQGGESDEEKQICGQVADLYVFLAKHLVAAESTSDFGAIDELKLVLEAETETWRAVCAQETGAHSPSSGDLPATGLNLQG
jgi:flagellar protein FliS